MTVYVDEPIYPYRGQLYCHLFTDGDVSELHTFAGLIGLKRAWFQNHAPGDHPHYDVSPSKRALALQYGAQFMAGKDWIKNIVIPRRKAML